jgi:hypothetical protein
MDLNTMRQLIEAEALQGASTSQNDLAFVDWHVPDRMLYSPVVSRNLTQPLARHLAMADRGSYPMWTLQDIIRVSTAEELADAEAFAREHYGPAPPPGSDAARPMRRQRRGCRGGKGRKRHVVDDPGSMYSPRNGVFSPRIMSANNGVPNLQYPPPPRMLPPGSWPLPPMPPACRPPYGPAPPR